MTIRVQVLGQQNLTAALKRKGARLTGVERAVALGTEDVKGEAIRTLQRGARSGRVYDTYFYTDSQGRLRKVGKRSIPHQASAPGEPLKSDTGHLASHVFARLVGKAVGEAGTSVFYGAMWERRNRPWLGPSFQRRKKAIMDRIARAVREAMRS